MVCADFDAYVACEARAADAYRDRRDWSRRALHNIAGASRFSSDATIRAYATRDLGPRIRPHQPRPPRTAPLLTSSSLSRLRGRGRGEGKPCAGCRLRERDGVRASLAGVRQSALIGLPRSSPPARLSRSARRDVVDEHPVVVAEHHPFGLGLRHDVPRLIHEPLSPLELHRYRPVQPRRFLEHIQHVASFDDVAHVRNVGSGADASKPSRKACPHPSPLPQAGRLSQGLPSPQPSPASGRGRGDLNPVPSPACGRGLG